MGDRNRPKCSVSGKMHGHKATRTRPLASDSELGSEPSIANDRPPSRDRASVCRPPQRNSHPTLEGSERPPAHAQ
jgi:hypothetical protein